MKTIKYFSILFLSLLLATSCSEDETESNTTEVDPMLDYTLLKQFENEGNTIEILSKSETLTVGYNELFVRIKDGITGNYVANAQPNWLPVMHMQMMEHSAPFSALSAIETGTVYSGYIVFQMPGNSNEYWDLTLNYKINDVTYSAIERLEVLSPGDGLTRVQTVTGHDDVRYVLALVEPQAPEVAVQGISALLFTMESMMSFPIVPDYTIKIDPRMPSMGNHGSPNNKDLIYNSQARQYEGEVSFTMTGLWRLNLKLLNDKGEVIKGEDITEANPESSLYFEVEF
ncbi:MAG: hypothetical protein CMC08_02655 [Flavobacteriaceae bacterium]|nr:hypothetical protein [Flavobacteriaceae bacterium]